MKHFALCLALSTLLTGCAENYELQTFDGKVFCASSSPLFTDSRYVFVDKSGASQSVNYAATKAVYKTSTCQRA